MSPIQVRLRELRAAKEWTQVQLAKRAGVRQAAISELESGRRVRVDLGVLERLCAALGVTPGELLERAPAKRRKRG